MLILGIETSCDETAAAVVEETADAARPWIIRSNVVASQFAIHREWGGVVPELASRQHLRDICGVVDQALADAGASLTDLGAVAVTQGPGLIGSLLVGFAFGKALAATHDLPFVPVHHLAGHIESLVLQHGEIPLPAVVLVVSGGHTSLYSVPEPGDYRLIGRTRDDAAGEAYDKVAKLLDLGYPGGPIVDRRAKLGDDRAVTLPVTKLTHPDRVAGPPTGVTGPFAQALQFRTDFSFSGLKTAVLRHVRRRQAELGGASEGEAKGDPSGPGATPGPGPRLPEQEVNDICASFQRVVVEALLDRSFDAAEWFGARSLGIAGGVSANSRLRADALARGEHKGLPVFLPSLALSTDNAAMIAAAGLRRFRAGVRGALDLNADASLALQ
jgi:N6-L-threonylcarbamoyladenine synthase